MEANGIAIKMNKERNNLAVEKAIRIELFKFFMVLWELKTRRFQEVKTEIKTNRFKALAG